MNDSSDDEGNNYEVSPDPHTNDVHINDNSDDERNDYEVNIDTTKKLEIMEQLKMTKKIIMKKGLRRKQVMKN